MKKSIICSMIALMALITITTSTFAFAQSNSSYSRYVEEPANADQSYDQVPLGGKQPVGEDLSPEGTEASSSPAAKWFWYFLGLPADVAIGILANLEGSYPDFAGIFKLIREVISALFYLFGFLFYALNLWLAWKALKPKKGGRKALHSGHAEPINNKKKKSKGKKNR
jgi:hypothetical protein